MEEKELPRHLMGGEGDCGNREIRKAEEEDEDEGEKMAAGRSQSKAKAARDMAVRELVGPNMRQSKAKAAGETMLREQTTMDKSWPRE